MLLSVYLCVYFNSKIKEEDVVEILNWLSLNI
jgi:hypothetical protein